MKKQFISERVKTRAKTDSRALMKGAGFTDEELSRPFIGVAGSWTNIFPGHSNLDKLSRAAEEGILMGAARRFTLKPSQSATAFPWALTA